MYPAFRRTPTVGTNGPRLAPFVSNFRVGSRNLFPLWPACPHTLGIGGRRMGTLGIATAPVTGAFTNMAEKSGLAVKLWRGERMCLIGMDVAQPEPDLVGFSIEVQSPGSTFVPLRNRINFSYDKPAVDAVTGFRNYLSTEAPFQKFRWLHFPYDPKGGQYTYRVTKQHMPSNGLLPGTSVTLDIPLDPTTYD